MHVSNRIDGDEGADKCYHKDHHDAKCISIESETYFDTSAYAGFTDFDPLVIDAELPRRLLHILIYDEKRHNGDDESPHTGKDARPMAVAAQQTRTEYACKEGSGQR